MDIGEQMLLCGAEVSRVEDCIRRMGSAYGSMRTDPFIITSSMEVTLIDSSGVSHTQTRRISAIDNDIEKLHRLNALVRKICETAPSCEEINAELSSIIKTQKYPFPVQILSYAAISGGFTVFFGGGILECLLAVGISVILTFVARLSEKGNLNRIFSKFFCSFVAALIALALVRFGVVSKADNIIIGNIMLLIPGVGITTALRDLFVGDSISGVLRTIEAVLFALAIAGGYFLAAFIIGG